MTDRDALHAARAVLGGRPLNLTTDRVFALLEGDSRISPREICEARRKFDAMRIGIALEAVEKAADRQTRLPALLRLGRAVRPHVKDRLPGWFRFLVALGGERGESMFRLLYERRPRSSKAQPRDALVRATDTRRAMGDMIVAGAILSRIEAAKKNGGRLTVQDVIEEAINCDDIATDEEAARKAFQRFRKSCAQLTGGGNTYRLEQYAGPVENYRGRWVALPDTGVGLPQLPPKEGGRPKT